MCWVGRIGCVHFLPTQPVDGFLPGDVAYVRRQQYDCAVGSIGAGSQAGEDAVFQCGADGGESGNCQGRCCCGHGLLPIKIMRSDIRVGLQLLACDFVCGFHATFNLTT